MCKAEYFSVESINQLKNPNRKRFLSVVLHGMNSQNIENKKSVE